MKITLDIPANSCRMVYMMKRNEKNELDYIDYMITLSLIGIVLSALLLTINIIL
jgi:hypothetical protein